MNSIHGIYNSHTFLRQHPNNTEGQGRSVLGGSWAERPQTRQSNTAFVKQVLSREFKNPTQDRPHNHALAGMGLAGGGFFGDLWKGIKEVAPVVGSVAPFIL